MHQQRIGRYQVLEDIAAGGQGAVYKAIDPLIDRIVAIKVLKPELTSDGGFLERFHREAALAAQIDHPNVVKIFDMGEDDGRHFIVMEYLPRNLADLIPQDTGLPIDRVLELGGQIAEGLAAAHSLGITHRDVKPQNVLITQDGDAKVTDFGIARAEDLSTMTATGLIMGTPHYMSPEQAQGTRADVRSDVYSLGCVMYQMLAGEVPFQGTTPMVVLRRHIDEQPRPIRELRREVPGELAGVVERAMEKDPEDRYQSAGEFAGVMRSVTAGIDRRTGAARSPAPSVRPANARPSGPGSAASARPETPVASGAGPRSSRTFLATLGVALVIMVVAIAILVPAKTNAGGSIDPSNRIVQASEPPQQPAALAPSLPGGRVSTSVVRLTPQQPAALAPSLPAAAVPAPASGGASPSGKIAFESNRDGNSEIYLMNADGSHLVNLTNNPTFDDSPSWSPDGSKIAFRSDRDGSPEIYVINADGSNPVNLTNNPAKDVSPSWSPDGGKLTFGSRRDGNYEIYVMNADGTNQANLTNNTASDKEPSWSPNGSQIAFVSTRDGNSEIYVMNADGSNHVRITNNTVADSKPSWSPDGSKIALMSSRDGHFEIYVMNADGTNHVKLTNSPAYDNSPSWSPDGGKITFVSNRDGNQEIYIMNADGSNQVRLTNSPNDDVLPSWGRVTSAADSVITSAAPPPEPTPTASPVAVSTPATLATPLASTTKSLRNAPLRNEWLGIEKIAYISRDSSQQTLVESIKIMNSDGTGRRLVSAIDGTDQISISPDGSRFAFTSNRNGDLDVYIINIDGTDETRLTSNPAFDRRPTWSPDGLRLAFISDRDGFGQGLYVVNADGTGLSRIIRHVSRVQEIIWSPTEPKIAFLSLEKYESTQVYDVYIVNTDGTDITRLTDESVKESRFTKISDLAWSPDGSKVAFVSSEHGTYIYVVDADGRNPTRLTEDGSHGDSRPAWSPDGSRILFSSKNDVYVMNADGSDRSRLTEHFATDIWPAWSRDGSRIAFASTRDEGTWEIYVMNADGSDETRLTFDAAFDGYPVWLPLLAFNPTPVDAVPAATLRSTAYSAELANVQAAMDAMMGDLELESVTVVLVGAATSNMAAFPDGTSPLYGGATGDYIRQPTTTCTYYVTSAGRVSQDSC